MIHKKLFLFSLLIALLHKNTCAAGEKLTTGEYTYQKLIGTGIELVALGGKEVVKRYCPSETDVAQQKNIIASTKFNKEQKLTAKHATTRAMIENATQTYGPPYAPANYNTEKKEYHDNPGGRQWKTIMQILQEDVKTVEKARAKEQRKKEDKKKQKEEREKGWLSFITNIVKKSD